MKMKSAMFGLVLAGAVAMAISSVVAQEPRDQRGRREGPRVWMHDGRNAQIGVTVDETADGVRVDTVESESPASRAGLRSGDVVVEVDGERVRSARQFARLIQESPEGRDVPLTVLRDGQRQTLQVAPQSRNYTFDFDGERIGRQVERSLRDLEPRLRELEPRLRELEPRLREFRFDGPFDLHLEGLARMTSPRGRLGVQLNELTPELAEYFGAPDGGVLISRVTPDSPAAKAGLRAGDVITSLDGGRVRDTDDLVDELRDKHGDVKIGIVRDKNGTSVSATLEEPDSRRGFRRPVL